MALLPRKNGARRVGALLAAFVVLGACAQLDHRSEPAVHVARSGDTLEWIADGYGVNVHELARANRLSDGARLDPGQRLLIPGGARIVHEVRRGETLAQIAARYRVRGSTIAAANRLGRWPEIEVGERLVLPREATLPPAAEPKVAARPIPPVATPPVAAAPPPADPDLEQARGLVERATDDYRSARFDQAVEHAQAAETLLAARSEDRVARLLSARSLFVTGSALAALGETERAKAAFARVHALDPKFVPPKGWLSPRLEKLYVAADQD